MKCVCGERQLRNCSGPQRVWESQQLCVVYIDVSICACYAGSYVCWLVNCRETYDIISSQLSWNSNFKDCLLYLCLGLGQPCSEILLHMQVFLCGLYIDVYCV